jgi:hypothetical protein
MLGGQLTRCTSACGTWQAAYTQLLRRAAACSALESTKSADPQSSRRQLSVHIPYKSEGQRSQGHVHALREVNAFTVQALFCINQRPSRDRHTRKTIRHRTTRQRAKLLTPSPKSFTPWLTMCLRLQVRPMLCCLLVCPPRQGSVHFMYVCMYALLAVLCGWHLWTTQVKHDATAPGSSPHKPDHTSLKLACGDCRTEEPGEGLQHHTSNRHTV